MAYYVRKISRAKWNFDLLNSHKDSAYQYVRADAITSCLRTTSDKLSVWKVNQKGDSAQENIEEALPLILGFEKLDTIDIVYLSEKDIYEMGLTCEHSPLDANVNKESLKEMHYNIDVGNYEGLGKFAQLVLKSGETHKRLKKSDIREKLKELLRSQKIIEEDMSQQLYLKVMEENK